MPKAVMVTPISENPSVPPAVISGLTRSLTIDPRHYSSSPITALLCNPLMYRSLPLGAVMSP
jgi:hypothetical protein